MTGKKLNSIEDKIYEYLCSLGYIFVESVYNKKTVAHDIVEIVEKEYATNQGFTDLLKESADLKLQLADTSGRFEGEMDLNTKIMKENAELKERFKSDECDLCNDLQDENEELKQQLEDIKYLNREEVEKIIKTEIDPCHNYVIKDLVTAICNLAYSKDKIIEDRMMARSRDGRLYINIDFGKWEEVIESPTIPITKDIVIAEGIVKDVGRPTVGIYDNNNMLAPIDIGDYEGKNIRLKIEILNDKDNI